jgi:O-antigen/teichoic acid export membrane protein/SAM-dependent methyltransferase
MSELRRGAAAGLASIRLGGTTVVAAVFASLYVIGAARVLGPQQFSDLAVCLSLSYVALLFLGPLNLTLIRFSSAYRSSDDQGQIRPLLRRTARLYAPWIILAIALSVMFATPMARALNLGSAKLVPWTGILVGLGMALGAVRATALGMNEHRLYSGSVLLDAVVRVVAGIGLATAYGTAGGALAGFLIGNAVALLVLGTMTRRLLPTSERPWTESAEVAGFMARALVFSALVAGLHNVDMIAAKVRLEADGAGDYAVALAVARGFLLLAAPFAAVSLARATEPSPASGFWARVMHEPAAAYLALSAPALIGLFLAPAWILALLFGGHTEAQAQFAPMLSIAFVMAGAFLILAHGEIRAGRFGFLVLVAATMAAELVVLALVPATPAAIAWTVLGTQAAAIGSVLGTPLLFSKLRRFKGSAQYWDERYARGGDSGDGSLGKFGEFKAEILNAFVKREGIRSVIEFGCGDGRQLSLAAYPAYTGFDVSPHAVQLCRNRFKEDRSKTFFEVAEYAGQRADLTMSIDVIYHLVEDEVFDRYMRLLFEASSRWVIVYASNHDDTDRAEAAHVRHRQFTRWVEQNRPDWALRETVPNRYPFTGDFRLGSPSEFFIFERA